MAGFVKLMAGDGVADDSPYKKYDLIAFGSGDIVSFTKSEQGLDKIVIKYKDGTEYSQLLGGNVYVMSATGKTISSCGTNVPMGATDLQVKDTRAGIPKAVSSMIKIDNNPNGPVPAGYTRSLGPG